jgi:hypothetical protein
MGKRPLKKPSSIRSDGKLVGFREGYAGSFGRLLGRPLGKLCQPSPRDARSSVLVGGVVSCSERSQPAVRGRRADPSRLTETALAFLVWIPRTHSECNTNGQSAKSLELREKAVSDPLETGF